MPKIPIAAVILDYGEVIVGPDANDWAKMVQIANVAGSAFSDAYWRYRLDYDRGLTVDDYWGKVAHECGAEFTAQQIRELNQTDAAHWMHTRQPMLDWISAMKRAGLKLAILSNMPAGVLPIFRRKLAFFDEFDVLIFSCELHVVKPDPAIYQEALRRLGIPAEESLFIDDKDYNVEGARALGIHGITFTSVEDLPQQLEGYAVPVPHIGCSMQPLRTVGDAEPSACPRESRPRRTFRP